MIKYFVIASDGQKYGPADIPTLNGWIAQGRLTPATMLEEEGSGTQVPASGVPALKFAARPPAPVPAAPPPAQPPTPAPAPSVPSLGNPYDTPSPMSAPQSFSSNYPRGMAPQPQPPAHTGAIIGGWATTIAAPVAIYFISYGLILIIWGFRAGFFLYQQGKTGQGIVMISLNVLWAVFWVIAKFLIVQRATGSVGP